jgi:hypothetical protein
MNGAMQPWIRGRSRCGNGGQRVPMGTSRDPRELGLLKVQRDRFLVGEQLMPSLSFHSNLTSTDYGPRMTSYAHGLHYPTATTVCIPSSFRFFASYDEFRSKSGSCNGGS